MIIRILTTGTNLNVVPEIARVIRVYNYRVPTGILESEFSAAGQILASDGASSPAIVSAPTVEGQKLIARLGQTVKMAWETDDTDLTPLYPGIIPGGRLTLTSSTPVTTSDVTSAGTLYYTPYIHERIGLYTGSAWELHSFTQRSLALTLTSGKNYDVFLYDNSGTLTLELSAAWTNDTTRADALTTQDGVYVKSSATTRRYLGTIRASGSNVTEDSTSKRYVWNAYNRVLRNLKCTDGTNSWNYTTATWRAANSNTTDGTGRVSYVAGLVGDQVEANVISIVSGGVAWCAAGIGIDSTSANSAQLYGGGAQTAVGLPVMALYRGYPSAGYHYIQRLEISEASGTVTWYGDQGLTYMQSGMSASIPM